MFKAASAPVVSVPDVSVELIPLSVLRLDLDPGEPWHVFLGRRGVVIRPDHIGRDSVSSGDAARLIAERREHDVRKARHLAVVEQEAIEADQRFRASLPRGVPVSAFAGDVSYGELVAAAEAAGVPRRRSLWRSHCRGSRARSTACRMKAASGERSWFVGVSFLECCVGQFCAKGY
jgi:hypothetical protein